LRSSAELAVVRAALARDDDYAAAGKPVCDWDAPQAREQLVDALFRDRYRALGALRGLQLGPEVTQGVAPDRVINVIDPQARHGHKSNARGFDGYKGHVAIDPDSEVICAAEVGAANAGDAAMTQALLADLPVPAGGPESSAAETALADQATATTTEQAPVVYGDAASGTGVLLADLAQQGVTAMTKVAAPTAPQGHFPKDRFRIDLQAGTVTCPARLKVPTSRPAAGAGWPASAAPARSARWRPHLPAAELAAPSPSTREAHLQAARRRQRDSAWRAVGPRPHLVRPPHPGRPGRLP
jgi:hypothetical protein